MRDDYLDYLWDRSGPPDPDVERLERVMRPLRSRPAPPSWSAAGEADARPPTPQRLRGSGFGRFPDGAPTPATPPARSVPAVFAAVAATLLIACAAGLWTLHARRPSWPLVRLAGSPVVGGSQVREGGRLAVGQWLRTDASSRASIAVSDIGRVDVDPNSHVRLVASRDGHHRLALRRGTVRALIWAPPGQFVVDTPSSTAVDLGCEYTLHVDDSGAGLVEVTTGWVGFEFQGRESFVPAGAMCATRPRVGPGTPYFADVSHRVRNALAVIDFGSPTEAGRRAALGIVLAEARRQDAITLWHLLGRVHGGDRDRVFDGLARFVPPPASVDSAGIRRGDRAMLDAWWNALDLGPMDWWRTWKRRWE